MPGTVTSQLTRVTDVENTGSWAERGGGAGSSFTQDFVVQNLWARGRRVDNTTLGFGFDNGSGIDLVDAAGVPAHVAFWMGVTTFAGVDTRANGGMRIRLGGGADPDTTPWSEWNVFGSDVYPLTGGWVKIVLCVGRAPDATSGTLDLNSVQMWAGNFTVADVGGNAPNCHIDSIEYTVGQGGLLVDAGTVPSPATFADFVTFEATAANGFGVVIELSGVRYVNLPLTIGDATATIFNDDGSLVVFADQPFSADGFLGLTVDLQNASTDVDISNGILASVAGIALRGDLGVNGTAGAFDASSQVFQNLRRLRLSSAATLQTCRIANCGQIDPTNEDHSGAVDLPGTDEHVDTQQTIDVSSASGDFELVMRVKATDWTPSTIEALAAHYAGSSSSSSFRFRLNTNAALQLIVGDGTAETTLDGTALNPVPNANDWRWLRVQYDQSAGQASFFWSDEAADTPRVDLQWIAVGTPTGTSRSMPSQSRSVLLGAENDATPASFLDGEIAYADLWIDGVEAPGAGHGDLVFRADWRTGPDFVGSSRADDFDGTLTWDLQGTSPTYAQGDDQAGGATLTGSTIGDSTSASALLWNVNADPNGELDDMSFNSAGTGHALEFGPRTPATITITGHSYVGYAGTDGSTGNEVLFNNSGKALTINYSGDTPTVRNGTGASTTLVNTVPLKITTSNQNSDLLQGVNVRYEEADGTLIAQGSTDASGVFSFEQDVSALPFVGAAIIARRKAFEDFRTNLTIGTGGFDIPVTLIADLDVDLP